MSGGSPVGGGFIRQRHSQGYLSGDDLEDDASSAMAFTPAPVPRSRTWSGIANDVVWVASAALIIYWGDRKSNFISLLLRDERIRRKALCLGLVGTLMNVGIILYLYTTLLKWDAWKFYEKLELLMPTFAPIIALLGLLSFCLFSFALWPIWSYLTLPLLLTLFMAFVVISPYLMIGTSRPQVTILRLD